MSAPKRRILVVDDSEICRELVKLHLQSRGYDVITLDSPFGFGAAVLREVVLKQLAVGIASSIIPFIPWFLDYFWPLWDDQNRALHDMGASTHVIKA